MIFFNTNFFKILKKCIPFPNSFFKTSEIKGHFKSIYDLKPIKIGIEKIISQELDSNERCWFIGFELLNKAN